eukprot:m.96081 g.96081  ORF g.96081 m.96081 type:complete len:119 (-) comp13062_c0_seq24:1961-2317(-)
MMATSTAASLDAISAHKHKHGEDVDGAVQATSYWIHRLQGPPTYAALICLALGNAPSQTLSLSDIYAFVQQHLWVVPSASTNHNWKSSVSWAVCTVCCTTFNVSKVSQVCCLHLLTSI